MGPDLRLPGKLTTMAEHLHGGAFILLPYKCYDTNYDTNILVDMGHQRSPRQYAAGETKVKNRLRGTSTESGHLPAYQ
jgi:hypothetical protein